MKLGDLVSISTAIWDEEHLFGGSRGVGETVVAYRDGRGRKRCQSLYLGTWAVVVFLMGDKETFQ